MKSNSGNDGAKMSTSYTAETRETQDDSMIFEEAEQLYTTEHAYSRQGDSRTKAIVTVNIYGAAYAGQAVLFKILSRSGVGLAEFQLFRNVAMIGFSGLYLMYIGLNPVTADVDDSTRRLLIYRCLVGQFNFFLINLCITLIPLSLLTILFQTNPFWITILSYFINREPILPNELLGMLVCFVAVIFISMDQSQEELQELDGATSGAMISSADKLKS